MKQIEAIIRVSKFEQVQKALHDVEVYFFTYFDVKGVGKETERREYRGTIYDSGYIARTCLKIVVKDENVAKTVEAILKAARTGEVGDGQIYVSDVEKSYRIRDAEDLKEIED